MKAKLAVMSLSLGLLAAPALLLAHHGNAIYDQTKGVTVTGTVTEFLWANPHCLLNFDVKDDKGNVVKWSGEVGPASDMTRNGWSKKLLKPGDEITVIMTVAKDGSPIGRIARLIFMGKTYVGMGNVPEEIIKAGPPKD